MNTLPPQAQTPTQPSTQEQLSHHEFNFTGQAGEFFRIWIVNVCLTIVTLGIYSAWAKVRTNQYFYGHTSVAGSCFEYTAKPMTILKGRLLAMLCVVIYVATTSVWPLTSPLFMLLFFGLLPWLISRSLKFRARNTRYRNIRFNFDGQYWDAFINFVLLPGLSLFTLGILYPFAIYLQQRWLVKHSSFGQTKFTSELESGPIYKAYILAFLMILGGIILIAIVAAAVAYYGDNGTETLKNDLSNGPDIKEMAAAFAGLLMLPIYYFAFVYIRSRVTNATLNHCLLEQHRLHSQLRARSLFWIYLSNTLAILFSIGLLVPWARIRIARYRAQCTQLITCGDMNSFTQSQLSEQDAIGEEMSDIMDVEFGL